MAVEAAPPRRNIIREILAWITLAALVAGAALTAAPNLVSPTTKTVYIGLVGPMSGPDAELGQAMVDGAQVLVDRVNFSGALGDKRLSLVIRDDRNDPALAKEIALEFAEQTDVLAVIGHLDDAASISAGDVYRDKGVPVITGSSGTPAVTSGNDWFFRVGLTTDLQAKLFVNYLARIAGETDISLIYEAGDFGESVKLAIEDEMSILKRTGKASIKLKQSWPIDPVAKDDAEPFQDIVKELSTKYAGEIIFLAIQKDTAIPLIRRLQDNPRRRFGTPIPYRMVGPDTLADPAITETFATLRRERDRPGLYTEGMQVVAPYLSDVSNQAALEFRRRFTKRFGREPSATAASFRDVVAVVADAVKRLGGETGDLSTLRQGLRDIIAGRDDPVSAIAGVTGNIYFDRDGNAVKPVTIGKYQSRQLVSPPVQLRPIFVRDVVNPRDLIQIHGGYFNPTRILHAGVEINEISAIDTENRRFKMDFHIWFRYTGDPVLDGIEFQNAAEPIDLGTPIEQQIEGDINYGLYRVVGEFKTDFITDDTGFGQTVLGFQLRHKTLNRDSLIVAPDFFGMADNDVSLDRDSVERRILAVEGQSWAVVRVDLFQDVEPIARRGNPSFGSKRVDGYSRVNLGIVIEPTNLNVRGILDLDLAVILLFGSGMLLCAISIFANRRQNPAALLRILWFPQTILFLVMLASAEEILISWMQARLTPTYYIEMAVIGFRIMWWMLPSWLFVLAVERFIWKPLEVRTGRDVPGVVRGFFSGMVYIAAALGVTAFVFDQKITSLLATSGVLAMIIGLAIQVNLSNIFSGIAINIEKPFRIGDWIKVSDFEPGKVVNMTWRTTRIETLDRNIICIPNSVASDTTVENLSYPHEAYRSELQVHVDPGARPQWVEKILLDAVLSAQGVLRDPAPDVVFRGVQEWSAEFHIRYFCTDYPASVTLDAAVWRDVIKNLRYAGFKSVIHEEFTLFHLNEDEAEKRDIAPILLSDVEVFEPFGSSEKAQICSTLKRRNFEVDEIVVEQGEEGESLFIIAEGALKVEIDAGDDSRIEVARLGVGDFFGEMALLTGEPRAATISAITKCVVLEIDRDDVLPVIRTYPDIAKDLSHILTRRTIENLRKRKAHDAAAVDRESLASKLLSRITGFFDVGGQEKIAASGGE